VCLLIVFSQADWRGERNRINISLNLYNPYMLIVPPALEYPSPCNHQPFSLPSTDSFVLCSFSSPVLPLLCFLPLILAFCHCSCQCVFSPEFSPIFFLTLLMDTKHVCVELKWTSEMDLLDTLHVETSRKRSRHRIP
jgi:hypothetical protein